MRLTEEPILPLLHDEQLLTMDEMATFLKVSERTVYRMMEQGQLPFAFKVKGNWRFAESDLRRWLASQKQSNRPDGYVL